MRELIRDVVSGQHCNVIIANKVGIETISFRGVCLDSGLEHDAMLGGWLTHGQRLLLVLSRWMKIITYGHEFTHFYRSPLI